LIETGNVTFGVSRSELTDAARATLDALVQRALAQPRTVIEVEGFTDRTGPQSYNLALSQRRAESVARYLVKQNVPLKSISMIGLGEESTPELLAAEFLALDPNANVSDVKSLSRRVRVRVYAPGDSGVSSASTTTGTDSGAGTATATGTGTTGTDSTGTDTAGTGTTPTGTTGAGTPAGTAAQTDSDSDSTTTDHEQR
jgi:hypothetical protein